MTRLEAYLTKQLHASCVFVFEAQLDYVLSHLESMLAQQKPALQLEYVRLLSTSPVTVAQLQEAFARDAGSRVRILDTSDILASGIRMSLVHTELIFQTLPPLVIEGKDLSDFCILAQRSSAINYDLSAIFEQLLQQVSLCSQAMQDAIFNNIAWIAMQKKHADDCAQVVAHYLVCHPAVDKVAYPGLKRDPSFKVATSTFEGGFGPLIDYCTKSAPTQWKRLVCWNQTPQVMILKLESELAQK